jgi:hypothetical protein
MEIKESAKDGVGCDCFNYYMFTSKCYTNTIKNMRNNEISWCAQNMNIVLNSSLNTIGKAYVILQRVSESSHWSPFNVYISTPLLKLQLVIFDEKCPECLHS